MSCFIVKRIKLSSGCNAGHAHWSRLLLARYVAASLLCSLAPDSALSTAFPRHYLKTSISTTMASGNAKIGQAAPNFEVTALHMDGSFSDIKLSDYKGKYVVLFFYPLDFTFVCPTEIVAFSDRSDEFRKINCEVIGASVDSHFSHLAWTNTPRKEGGLGKMKIPLLADLTKSISRDYGVLKEDAGISYRGLFIIDDKGILRQITINDLPVGRSVDETLRLVQAFQHTDKHGEVCPAGWKPGSDTIIPEVGKSQAYFSKQ